METKCTVKYAFVFQAGVINWWYSFNTMIYDMQYNLNLVYQ